MYPAHQHPEIEYSQVTTFPLLCYGNRVKHQLHQMYVQLRWLNVNLRPGTGERLPAASHNVESPGRFCEDWGLIAGGKTKSKSNSILRTRNESLFTAAKFIVPS
jgi:hypothetical protein